jgi:probable blue pigment (indigoidine) exporter
MTAITATRTVSGSAVALLVLAAASWGLGTVISKRALDELPPLALLPIQLIASLVFLGVLARVRGVRLRDTQASPFLGRLGLLNPGLAYALSLIGLVSISASLSVLLWALEPLLILFLAGWLLREGAGVALAPLALLSVVGLGLVTAPLEAPAAAVGVALTVAGVACCAVYTVAARRWLPSSESTAQVVIVQQGYALAAAIVAALVAAIVTGAVPTVAISPAAWLSAVGSGILYYGTAYWLYLSALRNVPASYAAMSFFLVPLFGVAGDIVFLGTQLAPHQWLGVAAVLVAVFGGLRVSKAQPVV